MCKSSGVSASTHARLPDGARFGRYGLLLGKSCTGGLSKKFYNVKSNPMNHKFLYTSPRIRRLRIFTQQYAYIIYFGSFTWFAILVASDVIALNTDFWIVQGSIDNVSMVFYSLIVLNSINFILQTVNVIAFQFKFWPLTSLEWTPIRSRYIASSLINISSSSETMWYALIRTLAQSLFTASQFAVTLSIYTGELHPGTSVSGIRASQLQGSDVWLMSTLFNPFVFLVLHQQRNRVHRLKGALLCGLRRCNLHRTWHGCLGCAPYPPPSTCGASREAPKACRISMHMEYKRSMRNGELGIRAPHANLLAPGRAGVL